MSSLENLLWILAGWAIGKVLDEIVKKEAQKEDRYLVISCGYQLRG